MEGQYEYKELYDNLIKSVLQQERGLGKLKHHGRHFNIHHIIPKSLGGSNDESNLVKLTHKEHYLAHKYLFHIYKDIKSKGADFKMANAFLAMTGNLDISAEDYEEAVESTYDIRNSQQRKDKLVERIAKWRDSLTEEKRASINKARSQSTIDTKSKFSPDKKQRIGNAISKGKLSKSPEEKLATKQKLLKTLEKRTDKQKDRTKKLKSKKAKESNAKMTPKQKEERKAKFLKTMQKRHPERFTRKLKDPFDKDLWRKNLKKAHKERSKDVEELRIEKIKKTLKDISPERRAEITLKRRRNKEAKTKR